MQQQLVAARAACANPCVASIQGYMWAAAFWLVRAALLPPLLCSSLALTQLGTTAMTFSYKRLRAIRRAACTGVVLLRRCIGPAAPRSPPACWRFACLPYLRTRL